MAASIEQYLHAERLPHIWCPGCGGGIVTSAFLRAALELDLKRQDTVVVGGIGCSSRAVGYLDFGTVHSLHGRALAFATGIKMARPDFTVVVITGDGDGAAIGGNHLIHAARRNIDLTVILFNNQIYGMTGGQVSPLTSADNIAATAPYGHVERAFDLCRLVEAAGATYVARGVAAEPGPAAAAHPRRHHPQGVLVHRGHQPVPHRVRQAQRAQGPGGDARGPEGPGHHGRQGGEAAARGTRRAASSPGCCTATTRLPNSARATRRWSSGCAARRGRRAGRRVSAADVETRTAAATAICVGWRPSAASRSPGASSSRCASGAAGARASS